LVARRLKVADDGVKATIEQAGHVLPEHPLWPQAADEACELRPEVPRVVFGAALTCEAKGLAGEATDDCVNWPSKSNNVIWLQLSDIGPPRHVGPVLG